MSNIGPDLRRKIEAFEQAGVSTDPRENESMICPCGYSGQPEAVLRYSEISEPPGDLDLFVCPSCGDA